MPSKNKDAHLFKVGDPAIVRDVPRAKIVNTGAVTKVTSEHVVFEGPSNEAGRSGSWLFKRKGTRWVQAKADHFELEPVR